MWWPERGLIRVPAAAAVRPTAIVRSAKTLRNPEVGWAAGSAHSAALKQAATDFTGTGVTLSAGATHVWDIPLTAATLTISGSSGVRLTFLSRSGGVLDDREFVADAKGSNASVPSGTARLVAMCLGIPRPRRAILTASASSARLRPRAARSLPRDGRAPAC